MQASAGQPGGAMLSAREIYARAAPGVVLVRARTVRTAPSPFRAAASRSESTGSGFVLDGDGLIVTNAHVVAGATDVKVTFSDRHTVAARPVGKDPDTDLALLRVDPEGLDLRSLTLGESSTAQVGDPTVAIGNPSGRERTLTTGAVSALRRRLTAPSGFAVDDVLQTDAAPNPANSGGPLLDAEGRVIGVNSQLATGGGDAGIGFAVPVDTAKEVIAELERTGHVRRAYLGVGGQTAPDGGVLVERLWPGSPAEAAGVREGDVLRKLDGRPVRSIEDVSALLERRAPGDVVAVELVAGARASTVRARLADRPPTLPVE
jgi:S1-C subfamily serine protease